MHTSQAATTMTMIAKTWPSPLFHMREKAISAMLAAFSMSSRQSRITSGLRRVSTPAAPIEKISALTTRYQSRLTSRPPSARAHQPGARAARDRSGRRPAPRPTRELERLAPARAAARLRHRADVGRQPEVHDRDAVGVVLADAAAAAREHHGADGRDEQQERGDRAGGG